MMVYRDTDIGFTLIELMVVLAILGSIIAIGVPIYSDYLTNAKINIARTNAGSLRLFMEDYQLSKGTYVAIDGQTTYTQSNSQHEIADYYGWQPDGDRYVYTVENTTDTGWDIVIHDATNSWLLRCEDRMQTCCATGDTGASALACP